jgi:putative copper export protein
VDAFRVAIRFLHLVAAVVWVGGSAFYLAAVGPAAKALGEDVRRGIERRFRDLVQLAIVSLLVTGAVITFDRLQREPGPAYAVTLGIKIALAIWMFLLAQDLASRGRRRLIERRLGVEGTARRSAPSWLILALGMVVLLLSDVLKTIGPA